MDGTIGQAIVAGLSGGGVLVARTEAARVMAAVLTRLKARGTRPSSELVIILNALLQGDDGLSREIGKMTDAQRETVAQQINLALTTPPRSDTTEQEATEDLAATAMDLVDDLQSAGRRYFIAESAQRRASMQDLHDGPLQMFLAAQIRLSAIRSETTDARVDAGISEAQAVLLEAIKELRDFCHGLAPFALYNGGTMDGYFVDSLFDLVPAGIDLAVDLPNISLDYPTKERLWYATRGIVANAVRHANPTQIRVLGRVEGEMVRIEVVDNGAGGAGFAEPSGGLAMTRDMLVTIGGELLVESIPLRGTNVTLLAPRHHQPGR